MGGGVNEKGRGGNNMGKHENSTHRIFDLRAIISGFLSFALLPTAYSYPNKTFEVFGQKILVRGRGEPQKKSPIQGGGRSPESVIFVSPSNFEFRFPLFSWRDIVFGVGKDEEI